MRKRSGYRILHFVNANPRIPMIHDRTRVHFGERFYLTRARKSQLRRDYRKPVADRNRFTLSCSVSSSCSLNLSSALLFFYLSLNRISLFRSDFTCGARFTSFLLLLQNNGRMGNRSLMIESKKAFIRQKL